MAIHRTAIIDDNAEIGENNDIGPFTVIEGKVRIGNDNRIGPSTIIEGNTTIGNGNHIHGHVYIGNLPQDLAYKGGETFVRIGDNNTIREYATVHRGTEEGSETVIGNRNYFMVASHVAHNCILGNDIIMVNGAGLGGYVEVQDHAFLGAFSVAHQFTRIGGYSICGILTKVTKDIPPFMMVDGNPALVRGLNAIGLKRNGFSLDRRSLIKKAFNIIYRNGNSISTSLSKLKLLYDENDRSEDLQYIIDFIQSSKRGVLLKSPVHSGNSKNGQCE